MFIFYSHFYTKQVTFVKNLAEKQKIQRLTYIEPCRGEDDIYSYTIMLIYNIKIICLTAVSSP